jgi:hypothetical protein
MQDIGEKIKELEETMILVKNDICDRLPLLIEGKLNNDETLHFSQSCNMLATLIVVHKTCVDFEEDLKNG